MAATAGQQLSYADCVAETEPVVRALYPKFITTRCNVCLDAAPEMKRCSRCSFAHYCGAECQLKVWQEHKVECKHLVGKLKQWQKWKPEYPQTDPSSMVNVRALLLFRLLLKRDSGALASTTGKLSGKKFAELISEEAKLLLIDDAAFRKRKYHEAADIQLCANFLYDTPIDDEIILEYSEKISILGVQNYEPDAAENRLRISSSILFDHKNYSTTCRPRMHMLPAGAKFRLIPFPDAAGRPLFDAHSIREIEMEGVELLMTKGARRGWVALKYHRKCECERCLDPEDDLLSAVACKRCGTAIPMDDTSFRRQPYARFSSMLPLSDSVSARVRKLITMPLPVDVDDILTVQDDAHLAMDYLSPEVMSLELTCSACMVKLSQARIELALAFMILIEWLTEKSSMPAALRFLLSRFDAECEKILPDCNLYRAKFHQWMADDPFAGVVKRADRLLKSYTVVRKCFPRSHSHLRPHLQLLCYALMKAKKCDELREFLAEYLQLMKIRFCVDPSAEDQCELYDEFDRWFMTSASTTDFSGYISSLSNGELLKTARKFLSKMGH